MSAGNDNFDPQIESLLSDLEAILAARKKHREQETATQATVEPSSGKASTRSVDKPLAEHSASAGKPMVSEAPLPVMPPAVPVLESSASTSLPRASLHLVAPVSDWSRFSPSQGQSLPALLGYPEGELAAAKNFAADIESSTFKVAGKVFGVKVLGYFAYASADSGWPKRLLSETADIPFRAVFLIAAEDALELGNEAVRRLEERKVFSQVVGKALLTDKALHADILLNLAFVASGVKSVDLEISPEVASAVANRAIARIHGPLSQLLGLSPRVAVLETAWLPLWQLARTVGAPDTNTVAIHVGFSGDAQGSALILLAPDQTFDFADLLLKRKLGTVTTLGDAERAALVDFGRLVANSHLAAMGLMEATLNVTFATPVFANARLGQVLEASVLNAATLRIGDRVLYTSERIVVGGRELVARGLYFMTPAAWRAALGGSAATDISQDPSRGH